MRQMETLGKECRIEDAATFSLNLNLICHIVLYCLDLKMSDKQVGIKQSCFNSTQTYNLQEIGENGFLFFFFLIITDG